MMGLRGPRISIAIHTDIQTYIHTYVHKYMHTHAHKAGGCKRGLFCRDCVRVICSCSTHRLRVYSLEFRAQRLVFRVGFGAW